MCYIVLFYKYTGYTTCNANSFLNFSHLKFMKKIWTLLLFQLLNGITSSGCTRIHSKVSILGSLGVLENSGFIQSTIENSFLRIKSSIVLIISTVSIGKHKILSLSSNLCSNLAVTEKHLKWWECKWSKTKQKFHKSKKVVRVGAETKALYNRAELCVGDLESNSCSEQVRRRREKRMSKGWQPRSLGHLKLRK